MTIKAILCTVVVAILSISCGRGPEGPAGATGPAGVANRDAIYCVTVTDATLANGYSLTAACSAAADLPLEGSCSSGTLPQHYYLAENEPFAWDNKGASPATWVCKWDPGTGDTLVDTITGTSAWICCVPPTTS